MGLLQTAIPIPLHKPLPLFQKHLPLFSFQESPRELFMTDQLPLHNYAHSQEGVRSSVLNPVTLPLSDKNLSQDNMSEAASNYILAGSTHITNQQTDMFENASVCGDPSVPPGEVHSVAHTKESHTHHFEEQHQFPKATPTDSPPSHANTVHGSFIVQQTNNQDDITLSGRESVESSAPEIHLSPSYLHSLNHIFSGQDWISIKQVAVSDQLSLKLCNRYVLHFSDGCEGYSEEKIESKRRLFSHQREISQSITVEGKELLRIHHTHRWGSGDKMTIHSPEGIYLGKMVRPTYLTGPRSRSFKVHGPNNEEVMSIYSPPSHAWTFYAENDLGACLAKISKKWTSLGHGALNRTSHLDLKFYDRKMSSLHKALLLGAILFINIAYF